MNLSIWNAPYLKLIEFGLRQSVDTQIRSVSVTDVVQDLASQRSDIGLIPADIALLASESLEILPAVAVSSWANPYVTLTLPSGFTSGDLVLSYTPDSGLTAFVASVVLKDHYSILAETLLVSDVGDDRSPHDVMTMETSEDKTGGQTRSLDLGQEWYELTNYPMVWSLFVARKDEADADMITRLRDTMVHLDDHRRSIVQELTSDEHYIDFCLNDLRLRLDDLALASLTSLSEYLYFYGRSDEIPGVQFASLPDENQTSGS